MAGTLVPCSGCARHVRAGEGSCPFCGCAVQAQGAVKAPLEGVRFGRSALFALGLTIAAGGVAGCEMAVAVYGAPAPMDGGGDGGATQEGGANQESGAPGDADPTDTGGPMARYGAPPPPTDGGEANG